MRVHPANPFFVLCVWTGFLCASLLGTFETSAGEALTADLLPSASLSAAPSNTSEPAAPKKAYDVLSRLQQRQGDPLPGFIGGREFQNREKRLPSGRYREYDVNPKIRGRPRDAERIVIEQTTGKAYYTGDHYRTFIPLE
jgi:ribonuclease T1